MKIFEVIIISTICSAITVLTILAISGFGDFIDKELEDFGKNLLLVIIPVLITVYSSKTIVNSWQIQKEKSEIRKKLLEDFDEGYSYVGQYMFELYYKMQDFYLKRNECIGSDELILTSVYLKHKKKFNCVQAKKDKLMWFELYRYYS